MTACEESRARGRDSRWVCLCREIQYVYYIIIMNILHTYIGTQQCCSTVYEYARPLIVFFFFFLKSDIEVDAFETLRIHI